MITSSPSPTWSPLLPRIPHKLAHSENSLETCSKHQTTFGSGFPQGTNSVRLSTSYLTSESLVVLNPFIDIGPSPVQQLIAISEYWSYVHILRLLDWAYPNNARPVLVTGPRSVQPPFKKVMWLNGTFGTPWCALNVMHIMVM